MPIIAITSQPASEKLLSAYRPIVLRCTATQTSPEASRYIPPVVFCDVYLDGVYYKSMSSTQPVNKPQFGVTDPEFQFDIQDSCQEVLKKVLPPIAMSQITEIPGLMIAVTCKLRSSTIDVNGFTVADTPVPVQGTGSIDPQSGGGTISNSFYAVNAVLQHRDNQDLEQHLNAFKTGTWSSSAFPLTHRPAGYKVCSGDNDVFPILYKGTVALKCLRLKYKVKGQYTYLTVNNCCIPANLPEFDLSVAHTGMTYDYRVNIPGSGPFTLSNIVCPSWMTILVLITVSGTYRLHFQGTPSSGDIGEDFPVSFDITNACSTQHYEFSITVEDAAACVNVAWEDSTPVLPPAQLLHPYYQEFALTGSAPFVLSDVVAPDWMTVAIVGNNVVLSGTPTSFADGETVSFKITNCSAGELIFSSSIEIYL